MALSDYYLLNDLKKKTSEYDSHFNYMIGKNEIKEINEKILFKKEKELSFQNFIGDEKDRTIPRKREIENLFNNSERVSGIKSSVDFLEDERDRFSATTKKQGHKITEPLRVNRGLGLKFNDNTQTGIHPMYRPEQKSLEDLRSKSDQKKKVIENPPITSGKKESKFLNYITKESLTRTPIKLLEKATELIKGKSYIYGPNPKKNITIKKEVKKKQIIGNINKNTSGLVIPGIFEPPKSTRKLTNNMDKSTLVSNNNNKYILNDKNSVELKSSQSVSYKQEPFSNLIGNNAGFQNSFVENPETIGKNTLPQQLSKTNLIGNNQGFYNNFTETPETIGKNTLSQEMSNINLIGNNQGFQNNFTEIPISTERETYIEKEKGNIFKNNETYNKYLETPELYVKNTLPQQKSNTNVIGNNQGFKNNDIEISETTMKEINTKETYIKNILPVFKNLYNKVTESPSSTERETYIEKEKGNIFKNNETYNKNLEIPESTLREINSENKNFQQLNDPYGLGYTSNIKEASITAREMYSENNKKNSNIKNSNKSFTINTTNLNPTQRQFDSINQNGNIGVKSKNNQTKVFDKKGICISEKKNIIESKVEKRKPTQRGLNIIPSKKVIGNVVLRPENNKEMLEMGNPNNAIKNHLDFC